MRYLKVFLLPLDIYMIFSSLMDALRNVLNLKIVFDILRVIGLKLKRKNCDFFKW